MTQLVPVSSGYGGMSGLNATDNTYVDKINTTLTEGLARVASASRSAAQSFVVPPHKERTIQVIVSTYDALERLRESGFHRGNDIAFVYAKTWITNLFLEAQAASLPILRPNVLVNAEDEIVFEWVRGSKRVSVYVTEDAAEYVRSWGANMYNEMDDGSANLEEVRSDLWQFLAR